MSVEKTDLPKRAGGMDQFKADLEVTAYQFLNLKPGIYSEDNIRFAYAFKMPFWKVVHRTVMAGSEEVMVERRSNLGENLRNFWDKLKRPRRIFMGALVIGGVSTTIAFGATQLGNGVDLNFNFLESMSELQPPQVHFSDFCLSRITGENFPSDCH